MNKKLLAYDITEKHICLFIEELFWLNKNKRFIQKQILINKRYLFKKSYSIKINSKITKTIKVNDDMIQDEIKKILKTKYRTGKNSISYYHFGWQRRPTLIETVINLKRQNKTRNFIKANCKDIGGTSKNIISNIIECYKQLKLDQHLIKSM